MVPISNLLSATNKKALWDMFLLTLTHPYAIVISQVTSLISVYMY